jgi:hypothetical protein
LSVLPFGSQAGVCQAGVWFIWFFTADECLSYDVDMGVWLIMHRSTKFTAAVNASGKASLIFCFPPLAEINAITGESYGVGQ